MLDDWKLVCALSWRECTAGLRDLRLFLMCLFLGVGALAVVTTSARSIAQGLQNNGRDILGGDVEVRVQYRRLEADARAFLEKSGRLSESVTLRSMIYAQQSLTPGADGRQRFASVEQRTPALAEVQGVDGAYPVYAGITLDTDSRPLQSLLGQDADGIWGAVAAPELLTRLQLTKGDVVKIGQARFRVHATIDKDPAKLTRSFALGPLFLTSSKGLEAADVLLPGSLATWRYRLLLPPDVSAAAWEARLQEAFPRNSWRIVHAGRASSRIGRFIDRARQFFAMIALSALLIGGIGVGNAVRGYLQRRAPTIAVLKCMGGKSRLILGIYSLQTAVLGSLGIFLGLLAGIAAPYAWSAALGDRLGWSAAPGVYVAELTWTAACGALTLIAFVAPILSRAQNITPVALFRGGGNVLLGESAAWGWIVSALACGGLLSLILAAAESLRLAGYFLLGVGAAFLVFVLLNRLFLRVVQILPAYGPAWRFALANLRPRHAPGRSLSLSLGMGITLLAAIMQIEYNLLRFASDATSASIPDFYFLDIQKDQVDAFREAAQAMPEAVFDAAPMLRGRIREVRGRAASDISVPPEEAWVLRGDIGLTWSATPRPQERIVSGRWWTETEGKTQALLSMDNDVASALELRIGDSVVYNILGRDVEVRLANTRQITWEDFSIDFVSVFSPAVLESTPHTYIATLKTTPQGAQRFLQRLGETFPNVSAIHVAEVLQQARGLIVSIASAIEIAALGVVVLGGVVLGCAVAAGERQKAPVLAVFRMAGGNRRHVLTAFLLEYGLPGLIIALVAAVAGGALAWLLISQVLQMEFALSAVAVTTTALLALTASLGLGAIGAWRAMGIKAASFLRNA